MVSLHHIRRFFGLVVGLSIIVLLSSTPANGGLVNHWTFDEGTGTEAADTGSGRNTAVLNADTDWVATAPLLPPVPSGSTYSLTFDGAGDFAVANKAGEETKGVLGTNPRSVSAWVKNTGGNLPIVSWGTNTAGQKWVVRTDGPNLRLEVNGGYRVGSTSISDDQWHHVAVTWEGGTKNNVMDAKLWVDGKLDGISDSRGQAMNTTSGVNVRIGRNVNDGASAKKWYAGQIDELRIYDHATTQNEVRALAGLAPAAVDPYYDAVIASTPVAYWRLGESGGIKAFNEGSIGSPIEGTYTGGPTLAQPTLVPNVPLDTAVQFDGTNDFINVPRHADLSGTGNATTNAGISYPEKSVESWFNTDSYGTADTRRVIAEFGGASNGINQYIRVANSGIHYFRGGAWENNTGHFPAQIPITPGENYYAVNAYDSVLDQHIVYLNGAPVAAKTAAMNPIKAATGLNAIGRKSQNTRFDGGNGTGTSNSNYFKGTIDEVAVYNAALDLFTVQTHYLAGSGDRLGITEDATLGVMLNYDAAVDTDGDSTWQDSIGSRPNNASTNQFDWTLDASITNGSISSTSLPKLTDAYHFDGTAAGTMTNSFEKVAGNPSNESASFEMVFKPDELSGSQSLLDIGGNGNGTSIWLVDSTLFFGSKNGAAAPLISTEFDLGQLFTNDMIAADDFDFVHLIGTVDVDNDLVSLYVNGQLIESISGTIDDWAGSDPGAIGGVSATAASGLGSTDLFTGDIALMRLYPTLLSSEQIYANYSALVPEPSSIVMTLLGLVGLGLIARRRNRRV